jgi:hypothetical protein
MDSTDERTCCGEKDKAPVLEQKECLLKTGLGNLISLIRDLHSLLRSVRELVKKAQVTTWFSSPERQTNRPKRRNSLYFSLLAGNLSRDEFASDCFIRQTVVETPDFFLKREGAGCTTLFERP